MAALRERKAAISSEIAILDKQAAVVLDYSKTLTGKDTTTDQLEQFLDVYATRQTRINDERSKLKTQLYYLLTFCDAWSRLLHLEGCD